MTNTLKYLLGITGLTIVLVILLIILWFLLFEVIAGNYDKTTALPHEPSCIVEYSC